VERSYEQLSHENTANGEFLSFTRNRTMYLVYCLPREMFVTIIEIQVCWEAKLQLSATSSSVAAPYRFSSAALGNAEKLVIELLMNGHEAVQLARVIVSKMALVLKSPEICDEIQWTCGCGIYDL